MFDNKVPPNNEESPPIKKILLAEDDASFRRFIQIILEKENYKVIAVQDGLEAMKATMENEFHAIVADAIMPNLTGFDLCRILRQNPQFQRIPFIILSGLEHKEETHSADAYLLKENKIKVTLVETLSNLISFKKLHTNQSR